MRTSRSPRTNRPGRIVASGMVLAFVATAVVSVSARAATSSPTWEAQQVSSALGYLDAVSCPTKRSCVAVGSTGAGSLAAHWDGTRWTILPIPAPPTSETYGVSCTAPDACTAVGSFIAADASGPTARPFAARWNGLVWVIQVTPSTSGGLGAVSCPSAHACTAVGWTNGATLVLRWNGLTWSAQPSPNPAGYSSTMLQGVSCTSRTTCVAVGSFRAAGSSTDQTLAMHGNGTGWSIQATPTPLLSRLEAVSCTAANACTAVGSVGDKSMAQRWDGSAWTIQTTPDQPGQRYNRMSAVSCVSATSCMAAGHHNSPAPPTPASWSWNGTAWTISTLPVPADAIGGQLSGISCVSASHCMAVGRTYHDEPTTLTRPLAERYS